MRSKRTLLHLGVVLAIILTIIPAAIVVADTTDTGINVAPDVCVPAIIDFESGDGGNLSAGDVLNGSGIWSGITVSTNAFTRPSPGVPAEVMVFDSANPTGGDPDLGTPNNGFKADGSGLCTDGINCGPGVGTGGQPGQTGANRYPLDNIMIISEDNISANPDDNAGGGTITFQFDAAKRIDQVLTLDIDDNAGPSWVRVYNTTGGGAGNLIKEVQMQHLGDNSFEALEIDAIGVRRLDIVLAGSGGVPAIVFCAEMDWGDLPYVPGEPTLQYPTTRDQDGPRHLLLPGRSGPILGAEVDAENDGIPTTDAAGDDYLSNYPPDDEDGVTWPDVPLVAGEQFAITVVGTAGSRLDAWIDFGGDGSLLTPGDQIATNVLMTGAAQQIVFTVPVLPPGTDETTPFFGRFRVSSAGNLPPTGLAADGEVEDYRFYSRPPLAAVMGSFTASPYGDGVVVQWESLTELNLIGFHLDRALESNGPWTRLTGTLISSQALGSPTGATYDYLDSEIKEGGVYYYRLISVKSDSQVNISDPVKTTVPAVGEPLNPPSPSALHRIFIPMVVK